MSKEKAGAWVLVEDMTEAGKKMWLNRGINWGKTEQEEKRTIHTPEWPPDNFTREEGSSAVRNANPKQAYGDKKVPLQLIPPAALIYMGQALKEGARKYGAYNWRENDVEVMTYIGATMRHVAAYLDREDIDPESGNHHLAHALASLAILVDSIECGVSIDNRPPEGAAGKLIRD